MNTGQYNPVERMARRKANKAVLSSKGDGVLREVRLARVRALGKGRTTLNCSPAGPVCGRSSRRGCPMSPSLLFN